MSKQKKKRTKTYAGKDASIVRPTITRVSAVNRNPLQQWWFDKKRIAKPVLITAAIVVFVLWLMIELIRVLS